MKTRYLSWMQAEKYHRRWSIILEIPQMGTVTGTLRGKNPCKIYFCFSFSGSRPMRPCTLGPWRALVHFVSGLIPFLLTDWYQLIPFQVDWNVILDSFFPFFHSRQFFGLITLVFNFFLLYSRSHIPLSILSSIFREHRNGQTLCQWRSRGKGRVEYLSRLSSEP